MADVNRQNQEDEEEQRVGTPIDSSWLDSVSKPVGDTVGSTQQTQTRTPIDSDWLNSISSTVNTVPDVSLRVAEPRDTTGRLYIDDISSPVGGSEPMPGTENPSENLTRILRLREEVLADYEDTITRKDFIEDERLQELIGAGLNSVFGTGEYGAVGTAASYGSSVLGGATARNWQGMTPEERFETWQNFNRDLSGGQTVTTGQVLANLAVMNDEEKAILGINIDLFDRQPGLFSGDLTGEDGTFLQEAGEVAEGLWDYTTAAIWDPTTALSLGVGRALTIGSAKATAQGIRLVGQTALKEALERGVTRQVAVQAANAARREAIEAAANRTIGQSVANFAAYSAVDLAANVGTDIAYQNIRMDTGVQEEYSVLQTGFAALGTVAIPALISGVRATRNALRNTGVIEAPVDLDTKLAFIGESDIADTALTRVNFDDVSAKLTDDFDRVLEQFPNETDWKAARAAARENVPTTEITDGTEDFWKLLLVGDEELGVTSIPQHMADSGFVFVRRNSDDKVTNYIADVIERLPEETVTGLVDRYSRLSGTAIDLPTDLPVNRGLAEVFRANQSRAGTIQGYASAASRTLSGTDGRIPLGDVSVGDYMKAVQNRFLPQSTREGHSLLYRGVSFGQSIYKRLLTSTLSTTAANVRGFGVLHGYNALADIVQGSMLGGLGLIQKGMGSKAASNTLRQSGSLLMSLADRGANLIDPNATVRQVDDIFRQMDEVGKVLNASLAGDAGLTDTLSRFGINPENKLANASEVVADFLQSVTFVKAQHEITTAQAFLSAWQTNIRSTYGMSYSKFLRTRTAEEALVEMYSPNFINNVIVPAVYRTQRETAGLPFGAMGPAGRLSFRPVAKAIEDASNAPGIGLLLPFGRFFNNTIAFIGDASGFNLAIHTTNRIANRLGAKANVADESFTNLLAKTAVGWGGVLSLVPSERENMLLGYAWNEDPNESGTVSERIFDWPYSAFKLAARMVAHKLDDGEIPEELSKEAMATVVTQSFKELDTTGQAIMTALEDLAGGEFDTGLGLLLETAANKLGRTIAGSTRFLDPVNQLALFATNETGTPDRRQGNVFYNEAIRYVDGLFGLRGTMPERNYPTRFSDSPIDIMKQIGTRTLNQPNEIERMLSSVGRKPFTSVRWEGPPELKNRLDEFFSMFVNTAARDALARNPNFEDMSLQQRQRIVENTLDRAKDLSVEYLQEMAFSSEDKILSTLYDLRSIPQRDIDQAVGYLGYKDINEILELPNAQTLLETIRIIAENTDEYLDMTTR